jgi:hypothetical protein
MRIVPGLALAFLALCCARPSRTVIAWGEMLRATSACPVAPLAPPPSWRRWPVISPNGELHLPSSFRSTSGATSPTVWLGSDSSEVAYVVSAEPSPAMAGRSLLLSHLRRPSYRLERLCRLRISGHDASIDTFQHVDSTRTDTVFGVAAAVALRSRQFAQILALTPTAAMRDSLLSAVASLRWP